MKYHVLLFYFLLLAIELPGQDLQIRGADISFLTQITDNNGIFRVNGQPVDALTILKNSGVNFVRLRIWHTPEDVYSGLNSTLQLASAAKAKGMHILLDFHYSDTWADPAHQSMPALWAQTQFPVLKDSIYNYTKTVLQKMNEQNTMPEIVQIGNEITSGLLWPEGRVGGIYNTVKQWNQFTELLKAAALAIEEAGGGQIKKMMHIDRGGDSAASQWFYDSLVAADVPFEYIGLSYYPWWHGSLDNLSNNLRSLKNRYTQKIILAETAYPWTLLWNDNTNNIVGLPEQLLPGYPASPAGQLAYLNEVKSRLHTETGIKGEGMFYWGGEWISTATFGSSWENQALFDFSGETLPALSFFSPLLSVQASGISSEDSVQLINFPNPFNSSTVIRFNAASGSSVSLRIYTINGELIEELSSEVNDSRGFSFRWSPVDLSSGMYVVTANIGFKVYGKTLLLLK